MTTTRSARLADLGGSGVKAHRLRIGAELDGDDLDALFGVGCLIVTLPPSGTEDYGAAAATIAQAARSGGVQHLVFTSSTSVYPGLCRVVTEEDAGAASPAGLRRNGEAVLRAEQAFLASGVPSTVLRLAGLYGYGRHPARYLSGRDNVPAGDAPVNLVHRDDVIAAVETIIVAGPRLGGQAFNVVASRHPSRRDVYTAECTRLAIPIPTFLDGRGDDWKEVSGDKLERVLDFAYRHPNPSEPAP